VRAFSLLGTETVKQTAIAGEATAG